MKSKERLNNSTPTLVINAIVSQANHISIGATDYQRWTHDIEMEMSGADAKTIVYVSLAKNGKSENATFHALPGSLTRTIAMSRLIELFDIAWEIKNERLTEEEARNKYFGKEIC